MDKDHVTVVSIRKSMERHPSGGNQNKNKLMKRSVDSSRVIKLSIRQPGRKRLLRATKYHYKNRLMNRLREMQQRPVEIYTSEEIHLGS